MHRQFAAHPFSPNAGSIRKLLPRKASITAQNVEFMVEKAKALVAEQGYLAKERQQLRLDLRQILGISRRHKNWH